jgi:elongation factor P
MITTADFRNGANILIDGEPYTIVWFQHHKPGKGGAVMRTKIKHLRTGAIIEKTFKSGEKFPEVSVEKRKKQFLYADGPECHFMDTTTFEQITVPKERLGRNALFLTENLEVNAVYLDDEFLDIELPINVELRVTHTVPGYKGDTVSNVMKPATLETGAEVGVPLFVKEGDKIRIDTRTGEYVERVNENS